MSKVLVIDDNADVRSVVAATLERHGFTTHGAETGLEGIRLARELKPDLILCDVNMPRINGYGVLAAVRELPDISTTPFIIMSGSAEQSDVRRGMVCGADDYLVKPFAPEDLVETVLSRLMRHTELLKKAQQRAEAARTDALQELTEQLSDPINGIMGAVSTMVNDYATLEPETVIANALQIRESAHRLDRLARNLGN